MHSFFETYSLAWIGPTLDVDTSAELQRIVAQDVLSQAQQVLIQGAITSGRTAEEFSYSQLLGELDADRLESVVLHPSFRYWLRALRRTGGGRQVNDWHRFTRHAVDFVWPELVAKKRLRNPLFANTDTHGGLRCVTRGLFIELGPNYADQPVRLSPSDSGVQGVCQDGMTFEVPHSDFTDSEEDPPNIEQHGYAFTRFPTVAEGKIHVSSRDPWLRAKLSGTNQRRDGVEFFSVDDEKYPAAPRLDELTEALAQIKTIWPEAYNDITQFTKAILIADFGKHEFKAFTVSSRQGAIFLGYAPPREMVEMVLHENAHVKLRQMQVLDPLLENQWDETVRLPVPWRPDPRPMQGILEGLFVFSHVAEYELRESEGMAENFSKVRSRLSNLKYAADVVEKNATLTEAGTRFVSQMKEWITSIARRASIREYC